MFQTSQGFDLILETVEFLGTVSQCFLAKHLSGHSFPVLNSHYLIDCRKTALAQFSDGFEVDVEANLRDQPVETAHPNACEFRELDIEREMAAGLVDEGKSFEDLCGRLLFGCTSRRSKDFLKFD